MPPHFWNYGPFFEILRKGLFAQERPTVVVFNNATTMIPYGYVSERRLGIPRNSWCFIGSFRKLHSSSPAQTIATFATLLVATCCTRLPTLLRRPVTCWVLLAQVFMSQKDGQTHTTCCAQRWMLRCVALKFSNNLVGAFFFLRKKQVTLSKTEPTTKAHRVLCNTRGKDEVCHIRVLSKL